MPRSQARGGGVDIMWRRRRYIAAVMTERPLTTRREMVEIVARDKTLWNPETGKPYCLYTISQDIKKIKEVWIERSYRDYGTWVSEQVTKLDHLETRAWAAKDYKLVLRCIDRRCKLLGLDEPTRIQIDWRREAQDAGLDPGEVFERYVEAAASAQSTGAETA